jgi:hypothetical protein
MRLQAVDCASGQELAANKAWRFMYVYSPAPIVGATGSIGAPLAIR